MSWTKVEMTPACDLADPGWTETPLTATCDLTPTATFVFERHDSPLDDDYESTTSGFTMVRMESVCDG